MTTPALTAPLVRVMAMVFTLCAAREDATPDQVAKMERTLVPTLRLFKRTRDTGPVLSVISDIMGHSWYPTGKWAQAVADPLGPVASEAIKRGVDMNKLLG